MSAPPEGESIRRLEWLYDQQERTRRDQSRLEALLAAAVTLAIVWVLLSAASALRTNLEPEKLTAALGAEAPIITPKIVDSMVRVAIDVAPVYHAELEKALVTAEPEIERAVDREVTAFRVAFDRQLTEQIDRTVANLENRIEDRLRQRYPNLLEEEGITVVLEGLTKILEEDTPEMAGRFFDRYVVEVDDINQSLAAFRPNRFETMSDEDLKRHYIHLWLMLLDHELMGIE